MNIGSTSRALRRMACISIAVLAGLGTFAEVGNAAPIRPASKAGESARLASAGPLRVAFYGDSLASEAQNHFVAMITADQRAEVRTGTYGGTAICDWFDKMRHDATDWKPRAVVVEFSGNALTPCMKGPDGRPLEGDAYVHKYSDDAATVMQIFGGARVYFAGSPISRRASQNSDFNGGKLDAVYRAIRGSHFIDAGAAVLDADGRYTETLPCLPFEPCMGADGTNIVRAPDGAHFCPGNADATRGVTDGCTAWSSGAFRYALAMAEPLISDFRL